MIQQVPEMFYEKGVLMCQIPCQFCKTFKNTFFSEDLPLLLLLEVAKLNEKENRIHTI